MLATPIQSKASPPRSEGAQDSLNVVTMMDEATKLRELLLTLYVSGVLWQDQLSDDEQQRLLDTVLAAGEGRDFEPVGLPFPRAA